MKNIHSLYFNRSISTALIVGCSLGVTETIIYYYIDKKNINKKYYPLINILIRTIFIIIFSEIILYLYYYNGLEL